MTSAATPEGPPRALLLWLSAANFVIGMGAFVVVGLLPQIAPAFARDAAAAGAVMTVCALVYTVASPVLVALTGRADRRAVLLAGLMLFAVGAAVCALASGFGALLAGRAVMAAGAGLVTPVTAAIAAGLAPPALRGRALATVFGGLTLAQVAGVPAGAWLGQTFGWPAAFAATAALAAATALVLARRVPRGIAVPATGLAALGRALASGWRMAAVAFGVLFLGGVYCVYAFLGVLLVDRMGLSPGGLSLVLAVYGLGAVAGNALGGRLADRIGPERTLMILCAAQAVLLPAVALAELPLVPMVALVVAWSIAGWSFMAAQQARLAALDPAGTPVMLALNAAAVYLAAAIGTSAGGAALRALDGWAGPGLAGAAFMGLAALSLLVVPRLRRRDQFVSR